MNSFSQKRDYKNTKITKRSHTYEVYASTYNIKTLNSFNSELQLKDIELEITNKLKDLLIELEVFEFLTTLALEFKKIENDDNTKYSTFYSKSKAETIINEIDNDNNFESVYATFISKIQKSLEKDID